MHMRLHDILISYANCRSSSVHIRHIENPTSFDSSHFTHSDYFQSCPCYLPQASAKLTRYQLLAFCRLKSVPTTCVPLYRYYPASLQYTRARVVSRILHIRASSSDQSLLHRKVEIDNFDSSPDLETQPFALRPHILSAVS
jgi:hypothetical protein